MYLTEFTPDSYIDFLFKMIELVALFYNSPEDKQKRLSIIRLLICMCREVAIENHNDCPVWSLHNCFCFIVLEIVFTIPLLSTS